MRASKPGRPGPLSAGAVEAGAGLLASLLESGLLDPVAWGSSELLFTA
jgi:hypothetical protein